MLVFEVTSLDIWSVCIYLIQLSSCVDKAINNGENAISGWLFSDGGISLCDW